MDAKAKADLLRKLNIYISDEVAYYVFYGRLLQFINGNSNLYGTWNECMCPLDGEMYDRYFEELTVEDDLFEMPLCGASEGICGFQVEVWYHYIESDRYEWIARKSRLLNNGEQVRRLLEEDECDERSYHLKFDEGGLWDTMKECYPDYFDAYSNFMSEEQKEWLMTLFHFGMDDAFGEEGFDQQISINIRNKAADQWFDFLQKEDVSGYDRKRSGMLFGQLVNRFSNVVPCSQYVQLTSYESTSPNFSSPIKGTSTNRTFELFAIQARNASIEGYCYMEYLQLGLLPKEFLVGMLQIVAFLEEMEEKYHFLSGKGKDDEERQKTVA